MKVKIKVNIYLLVLVLLLVVQNHLHAQKDIFARLRTQEDNGAVVNVIQDNSIVTVLNFHLSQQKAMNGVKGYRISIYLGSGQEASKNADLVKAKFMSKYEDIASYKVFVYPFYNIHVGDFRTKSEALKFQQVIQNEYPDAFIREDIITLTE